MSLAHSTHSVLIVDDEVRVLRVARMALQSAGFHVLTATDGAEAEAACRSHSGALAVVMDIILADGDDGFALAQRLQVVRNDLKFIYVSGDPGQLAYRPLGTRTPFLCKPFTPAQLVQAVRELTGKDPRNDEIADTVRAGERAVTREVRPARLE